MRLGPFGGSTHMENRLLEIDAIQQFLNLQVIPMLTDAIKGLVKGGEALLPVEN